jgi:hypothetical protein
MNLRFAGLEEKQICRFAVMKTLTQEGALMEGRN